MKVAFLIERFDPRRGGMETSACEFLTELAALGVEPHVVTQGSGTGVPPVRFETHGRDARATTPVHGELNGMSVHALDRGGWGRAGRYRHFVESAQRLLARERWDVIHAVTPCLQCDLYQPRAGVASEALARTVATRKNPVTKMFRRLGGELDAKQRLLARLERELLAGDGPPLVAALSRYMRRQLEAAYALPPERVRDVFNGVTVALPEPTERLAIRQRLRQELNLRSEERVAIFAGHNFRRKGLERLMEALALPEAQPWRLLVAGKDSTARYRRLAARRGVAARVQFLGNRSDVRQLFLAADVCALPTFYDPCSRVILEALSLGVPAITTRCDGSAEAIRDGETGFVVAPPDEPDAARQIARGLHQMSDGALLEKMSRQALALRTRLSMRRHAEEIVRLYEEICRRKSTASSLPTSAGLRACLKSSGGPPGRP